MSLLGIKEVCVHLLPLAIFYFLAAPLHVHTEVGHIWICPSFFFF